jgi:hypothetical protein
MRRELFRLIKEELERWNLGLNRIDVFRDLDANELQENAFPKRPSAEIDIGSVRYGEGGDMPERYQDSDPFVVTVHLYQDITKFTEEDWICRWDLLEWVAIVLHGFGQDGEIPAYFAPFRRLEESTDEDRGLAHDIVKVETAVHGDDRAETIRREELEEVTLEDIGLSIDIVP